MKLITMRIFLVVAMLGISISSFASYYGQSYPEFMANTWLYWTGYPETEDNKTDQQQPDVAMIKGSSADPMLDYYGNGYFIIVWQSDGQLGDPIKTGSGYSDWDIYAMRFDNMRNPIDYPEVALNTNKYGAQEAPSVATNAYGDIVVAWRDNSLTKFRRWSFVGPLVNPEQVAASGSEPNKGSPYIAIANNGDFVITWRKGGTYKDIRARFFDSAGVPMVNPYTSTDAPFDVNDLATESELEPSIDMDAAGNFVIAWQTQISGAWGVHAKKFYWSAGFGSTLTDSGEFAANFLDPYDQTNPSCALDETGKFIIVWQSKNQVNNSSGWDVYARRFDNSNPPVALDATEFQVNNYTQNDQLYPDVDVDANGYAVVVWQSYDPTNGEYWGIRGAEIKPYGLPGSPFQQTEFQVNNETALSQTLPAVAVLRAHNYGGLGNNIFYVAVWQGNQACPVQDIYYKLYDKDNDDAITLEEFNAYSTRNKVVLSWKTGTEIDNLGFFLVRSEDLENNYKMLNNKIIPTTNGNTFSGNTYSFIDGNIDSGTLYYYWLISVDIHGGYTVYGPVDVITNISK